MPLIPDYPPPGAFAIQDPYEPWRVSYWTVGEGLKPWPSGARGKYGPLRPPRTSPGSSAEQRRDAMAYWRAQTEEYRVAVLKAIAADPAGAAARFTRETERCASCRSVIRAEDLPDSAAAGRGRAVEVLTDEQRDAMAVDLRRAGHPEALIAQALGIGTTRINRVARRAGVGAPLRPRRNGSQA